VRRRSRDTVVAKPISDAEAARLLKVRGRVFSSIVDRVTPPDEDMLAALRDMGMDSDA
jgi:hypothetical protein